MASPTNNLIAGRFRLDPRTDMLHDTKFEIEPFATFRLDEIARTTFNSALERLYHAVSSHQKG